MCSSDLSLIRGSSSTQGGHQVAQKLSSSGLPARLFMAKLPPWGKAHSACQKPSGGGVPAGVDITGGAAFRHHAKPKPASAAAPPTPTNKPRRLDWGAGETGAGAESGVFMGPDHAANCAGPPRPRADCDPGGRVLGRRADRQSRKSAGARRHARPARRCAPGCSGLLRARR